MIKDLPPRKRTAIIVARPAGRLTDVM